jgi:hypothetical protein
MAVSDRSLCFSSSNAAAMNNNNVLSSVQNELYRPRTRTLQLSRLLVSYRPLARKYSRNQLAHACSGYRGLEWAYSCVRDSIASLILAL